MNAYGLVIDVDGTVHDSGLDAGADFHGYASTISAGPEPWSCTVATDAFGLPSTLICWLPEYGHRDQQPVNAKAWLLYARSPTLGRALIHLDDRQPLPAEFVAAVSGPIDGLHDAIRATFGLATPWAEFRRGLRHVAAGAGCDPGPLLNERQEEASGG